MCVCVILVHYVGLFFMCSFFLLFVWLYQALEDHYLCFIAKFLLLVEFRGEKKIISRFALLFPFLAGGIWGSSSLAMIFSRPQNPFAAFKAKVGRVVQAKKLAAALKHAAYKQSIEEKYQPAYPTYPSYPTYPTYPSYPTYPTYPGHSSHGGAQKGKVSEPTEGLQTRLTHV